MTLKKDPTQGSGMVNGKRNRKVKTMLLRLRATVPGLRRIVPICGASVHPLILPNCIKVARAGRGAQCLNK